MVRLFASLALSVVLLSGAAAVAWGESSTSEEPARTTGLQGDERVSSRLKAALQDARTGLGKLEPWQDRIFEEEVLPQYQRFIRDYRASQSGISADVDLINVQNYLRFRSPGPSPAVALAYVRGTPECERCAAASRGLADLLRSRLQRRGFVTKFLTESELGTAAVLGGSAIEERVSELAHERSAPLSVVIRAEPVGAEEIDAAHAGEIRFRITTDFRTFEGLRSRGSQELGIRETFEAAALQLISDSMTTFGSRVNVSSAGSAVAASGKGLLQGQGQGQGQGKAQGQEQGPSEVLLQVSGIRDFRHFAALKAALQERYADLATLQEREVSRGAAQFVFISSRSSQELRQKLPSGEIVNPPVKLEVRP